MKTQEYLGSIASDARKAGAAAIEVYWYRGDVLELMIRNGSVTSMMQAAPSAVALRMFLKNRLAFVATSDLSQGSLSTIIDRGIKAAEAADEVQSWRLPEKLAPYQDLSLFDPQAPKLGIEQRLELVKRAEQYAVHFSPFTKRIGEVWYRDVMEEVAIANGAGQFTNTTATRFQFGITVYAEKENMVQQGEANCCSRFFSELEKPELVGRRAAVQALSLLGGKSVTTGTCPMVLDPYQAGPSFWQAVAGESLGGSAGPESRSVLAGKLGKQAASELVTLIDDPSMQKGLCSSPFDAEGNPTRELKLIEKGIVRNLMHDSFSAFRSNSKPTGSTRRLGFSKPPLAGPSNLYLAAGSVAPEYLINGISDGIYVVKLLNIATDPANDKFSALIQGRRIKDGQVADAVSGAVMSESISTLLANIDGVGSDLAFTNFNGDYSVNTPTFRIAKAAIYKI